MSFNLDLNKQMENYKIILLTKRSEKGVYL